MGVSGAVQDVSSIPGLSSLEVSSPRPSKKAKIATDITKCPIGGKITLATWRVSWTKPGLQSQTGWGSNSSSATPPPRQPWAMKKVRNGLRLCWQIGCIREAFMVLFWKLEAYKHPGTFRLGTFRLLFLKEGGLLGRHRNHGHTEFEMSVSIVECLFKTKYGLTLLKTKKNPQCYKLTKTLPLDLVLSKTLTMQSD